MKLTREPDHKSQVAPGVGRERVPEPDRQATPDGTPTHDQIAVLAHQLWMERGQEAGSAEQDWLDAEQSLIQLAQKRPQTRTIPAYSGAPR